MSFLPLSFLTNQAKTGAALASQAGTASAQPSGSFFGELGGLISTAGGIAIQTVGDIARLKAEAELARHVPSAEPRLVPGQPVTAETATHRFLPTQFIPIGKTAAQAPAQPALAQRAAGLSPVVLLLGGGILLALILKRS